MISSLSEQVASSFTHFFDAELIMMTGSALFPNNLTDKLRIVL